MVADKVKTSLIIPCYFVDESFIKMTQDCVDSLEHERPDEVIIVNDGSPEPGSITGVTTIIDLIDNCGFAAAVNEGLEDATGDILIISNNDIFYTPKWLTELIKPLEEGFDISSISTSDQGFIKENKITEYDRFGSLWAMKREVYETIGGLDEQFGIGTFEDADYYLRALEEGFRIAKNWNAIVGHLGRATFDAVDPLRKNFERNKKLFIKKHGRLI